MINLKDAYGSRANAPSAEYPNGSFKNETAEGTNDGTPLDKLWGDDFNGFSERLLIEGGVGASGNADTALASDRFDAMKNIIAADVAAKPVDFSNTSGTQNGNAISDMNQHLDDLSVSSYVELIALSSNIGTSVFDGQRCMITGAKISGWGVIRNKPAHGITSTRGIQVRLNDDWIWDRDNPIPASALWWELPANGADRDDILLNECITDVSAFGGGEITLPPAAAGYRLEDTVNVPVEVDLIGSGRYVYIVARAGTYASGYAILSNTTDGTDWIASNPNNRSSQFKNFRIETDQPTLKCFAFSGSPVFEKLAFKFFDQSIYGSTQFNDLVYIKLCTFASDVVSSSYQVELENTGDAVVINQMHCFNIGNDPATPMKALRVVNNSVSIEDSLLGDMELVNCAALSSVRNCGTDGGKWIVNRSHMTFENCGLTQLESGPSLELQNDTEFTYSVVIDQFTFTHDLLRNAWNPNQYDVKIANGFNIDIRNAYKSVVVANDPRGRNLFGIQIENEAGADFTAFNKYSHFYSKAGYIEDQKIIRTAIDHSLPTIALTLFKVLAPFASLTWLGATGTYYYRCVPYWDVGRSISRTDVGGEKSIALTNGGTAAVLEVGDANYSGAMIIRVYRGTAANSYSSFADIPVVDTPALIDNGDTIAGVMWQSRAGGPAEPSNSLNLGGMKVVTGCVSIRSSAPPTLGAWSSCDEVINTNLSIDANNMVLEGWKRITTGSGHTLGTDWSRRYISDVSPAT